MSSIKSSSEKKLMLCSGRAYPELADEVADHLGVDLTPVSAYDFANGEIFVRFEESVRGCDAFVLQSHSHDINKWIMEQLIMVDALKRASAKRITVVMPVLRLRAAGQEAPRPRAHLRPAGRRHDEGRRRRPADGRRPPHLADPGLLRRSRRPPLRAAAARPVRPRPRWTRDASPSSPRTPAGSGRPSAGRTCSAASRSRSSTRPADPLVPNEATANRVVGMVEGRTCVLDRRHDRHRRHDREGRRRAVRQRRRGGHHRRDPRRVLRAGGRPAQEQPGVARSSSPTRCR